MAAPLQHMRMRISANNGLPWTQTQEYIDLCRTIGQPGDPTSYHPAHPQGSSSTDLTQFQVGLARSNINNLPDIFYQLWPSKEWWDHTKSARPPPKKDANGKVMYERTPRSWAPRELLDFPVLKNLDTISSEEEAWFLELLIRMDGRLEWADILMRMEYPGFTEQDEQKFRNRLQQRMARLREKFTMVSWRDTAGDKNRVRDRVLIKLSPDQLAARDGLGSTRGSTPGSIDSQGRVIPVPGRRAWGTGNTAAQQQRPQAAVANAEPSNALLQQNHPAASTDLSAVNSQQTQKSALYVGNSLQASFPILGGPRVPDAASTERQQTHPSPSYAAKGFTQQVQDTTSYAGPTSNQSYRHHQTCAGPLSDEHTRATASHAGTSAGRSDIPQVSYSSSSEGSDGVDEIYGNDEGEDEDEDEDDDESDDSEASDEDDEDGGNDGHDGGDENDQHHENGDPDVEIPSAEMNDWWDGIPAEERWLLERYLEQDRNRAYMCLEGKISLDELMWGMTENEAELKAGLRRARRGTSDDDDTEKMQSRRAKRTRRGGDAAASSGQPLSQTKGYTGGSSFDILQPGPAGEYNRQRAWANTSHRTVRPLGSAVQRLHNDRARRPAPKATVEQKATHESLNFPQSDVAMGDVDYTVLNVRTDSQQPQDSLQQGDGMGNGGSHINVEQAQFEPSSHRQRHSASERFSSVLNPAIGNFISETPAHVPARPPDAHESIDSRNQPSSVELTRNDVHIAPRRESQQSTARYIQDDPFFSDELFNGMLNGQPDNNHVGSMYTRSQQREVDDYYQRLMAPRPRVELETNTPEDSLPLPPHFRQEEPRTVFVADLLDPHSRPQAMQPHVSYNIPGTSLLRPVAQVPARASQSAGNSGDDLDFGDITHWNSDWSNFVNDHDAEALLRGHYPDEYRGS